METALHQATEALATALQGSEESKAYLACKELVMQDEANRVLLKEYQKTQTTLQMKAAAGQNADAETIQRFSKLSELLYMNEDIAQYLLAQLKLHKRLGEIFQQLTSASGLEMDFEGM